MINSILKLYSYSPENLNLIWVRFYFDERRRSRFISKFVRSVVNNLTKKTLTFNKK